MCRALGEILEPKRKRKKERENRTLERGTLWILNDVSREGQQGLV
jgi:hypothetical protein